MDREYVEGAMGGTLKEAVTWVAALQPEDPIGWLAEWLTLRGQQLGESAKTPANSVAVPAAR